MQMEISRHNYAHEFLQYTVRTATMLIFREHFTSDFISHIYFTWSHDHYNSCIIYSVTMISLFIIICSHFFTVYCADPSSDSISYTSPTIGTNSTTPFEPGKDLWIIGAVLVFLCLSLVLFAIIVRWYPYVKGIIEKKPISADKYPGQETHSKGPSSIDSSGSSGGSK